MLTPSELDKVVNDLIKKNSESNVRDFAREVKEIESEIINISKTVEHDSDNDAAKG